MDVMSDVLLAVRLTGAVFFDVAARSPFVTESPSSGGGRGMNFGRIFQRDGTLVATTAQESLMRIGRR